MQCWYSYDWILCVVRASIDQKDAVASERKASSDWSAARTRTNDYIIVFRLRREGVRRYYSLDEA